MPKFSLKSLCRVQPVRQLAVLLLACGMAMGVWAQDALVTVVNGTPTDAYPAVGALAFSTDLQAAGFCTGTLITPTRALTAAHCVWGESTESGILFVIGGVPYPISEIAIHPSYNPGTLQHDVAVLTLESEVTDITPMPLYRQAPTVGQTLLLVGYGLGGTLNQGTDGGDGQFGTKREGTVKIDEVTSNWLIWRFNTAAESNTAPGDSGGPAFLDVDGTLYIAGLTSWGEKANASFGDTSYDTRVDTHLSFIDNPEPDRTRFLVYRLTERGFTVANDDATPYTDNGFLLLDNQTGASRLVARRDTAAGRSIVTSSWSSPMILSDMGVQASSGRTYEALTASGPADWRVAWGPALRSVGYQFRMDFGRGTRLTLRDDSFTKGSVALRFDSRLTTQAQETTTLDELATTYNGLFPVELPRIAEAAATTTPSQAKVSVDDQITVHRVSGLNRIISGEESSWIRLRGYLAYQPSTRQATLVIAFLEEPFSFGYELPFFNTPDYFQEAYDLDYSRGDFNYHIIHGVDTFYVWNEDAFGYVERISLIGIGAAGELPRILRGNWEYNNITGGATAIDTTSLRSRLDQPVTDAAADMTFTEAVTFLRAKLSDRYGALFF